MRPIKLTLIAFGPYKDKEEIDFTELGEHNLFVISGKTGSGKTTIFDGISFALYGSASGEDRDTVLMLRSQFADDNLHTAVEFIFELKGRKYRVLRQLGHIKRGNKTKTGEKYEFFEIKDDGEIPKVDRQIVSEINKKIEDLIGLTQEQFKQIVMLPQGEFRKFLTSETENKEAILRRLFKTEPYQNIEYRLKEKQDELKEVYNKDAQQLESLTKNIVATLPEREDSHLFQLLQEESYNTYQVLEELVSESEYYRKKLIQDEKNYQETQENLNKQRDYFSEAKVVNDQFDLKAQKMKEKKVLDDTKEEHLLNEANLTKAERANQLIPYENQLLETEKELHMKQNELGNIEKQNKTNHNAFIEAEKKYYKAKETEKEIEKAKTQIEALNRYVPIVKEVKILKTEIEHEEKNMHKLNENLNKSKNSYQKKEDLLEQIIKDVENTSDLIQKLPEKQQLKLELQNDWKKLHQYEEASRRLETMKVEYKKNKEAYDEVYKKYEKEENKWLNNEAAVLANKLEEGEACKVCGSTTHPDKAIRQADVLEENELEEIKKLRDKHLIDVQKLETKIQYEENIIAEAKNELQESGYHIENIKKDKSYIEEKGKKIANEINNLNNQKSNQQALISKRNNLREEIKKDKKNLENLSETLDKKRNDYNEKKASLNAKLNSLPEKYQDLFFIESELKETEALKIKLESELKEVEANLKNTENEYLKSSTNLKQMENQVADITKRYSKVQDSFNQVLKESAFKSISDYQAAKLTKEEQNELRELVEKYNNTYLQLTNQLNQLEESLKNQTKKDLEALEIKIAELQNTSQTNYDLFKKSERAYEDSLNLTKHIKAVRESLKEKEEELSTLTDLYDVTRGHNTLKISFERYLQIDYLEQIIHAANVRLVDLSNGQFNLILSDRQETHGRQSGLALDVNDAYTGQTRDVKTLSGGEKFNASLALALGMSDVIQSFEGNISIEMMFIDEGFGSLDEESLTKSIDTLIDLQKSGRLIGVISHVEELKAVFPAILEVEKTKVGYSKTEFKLK